MEITHENRKGVYADHQGFWISATGRGGRGGGTYLGGHRQVQGRTYLASVGAPLVQLTKIGTGVQHTKDC